MNALEEETCSRDTVEVEIFTRDTAEEEARRLREGEKESSKREAQEEADLKAVGQVEQQHEIRKFPGEEKARRLREEEEEEGELFEQEDRVTALEEENPMSDAVEEVGAIGVMGIPRQRQQVELLWDCSVEMRVIRQPCRR